MSLEISNKGDNLNNPDILIQSDYKFLETDNVEWKLVTGETTWTTLISSIGLELEFLGTR